jgi:hypothetical protein
MTQENADKIYAILALLVDFRLVTLRHTERHVFYLIKRRACIQDFLASTLLNLHLSSQHTFPMTVQYLPEYNNRRSFSYIAWLL